MKKYYILLSILAIIFILSFSVFPQIDVWVSRYFYDETSNSFPMFYNIISRIIYKLTKYLAILMFLVGSFCFFYDLLKERFKVLQIFSRLRNVIKISKQEGLYLASVFLLIPYFLIHDILKPLWGRARPFQINDFSGIMDFTPIYNLNPSFTLNSFPSGHASMAFSILAISFAVQQKYRFYSIRVFLLWGVLASLNRVVMGGHFLSDVMASSIITIFGVLLLKKLILDEKSKILR